jgi:uncharacterized protein (DUF2267 family)
MCRSYFAIRREILANEHKATACRVPQTKRGGHGGNSVGDAERLSLHRQQEEIMSATGVSAFDKTLQVTNTWLSDIMKDHGPDRQLAWHILGAVLHSVRDRLPIEVSAHLSAQLPLLVRGSYYDQYVPSKAMSHGRSRDAFFEQIKGELSSTRSVNTEQAARMVFSVLNHYLDPGEARKVRQILPEDIRALWPEPDARH